MAQIPLVQGFAELISGDFSYASKYETEISFPAVVSNKELRNLSIRCDTISIPGRNLRTVMNGNIYGPPHDIVQGYTFGEVSASFYLSSDMRELRLFHEWQDSIVDKDTYDLNYYKETVGTVKIFSLDKKENRVFGIELEGRAYIIKKEDDKASLRVAGNVSYISHEQDLRDVLDEN